MLQCALRKVQYSLATSIQVPPSRPSSSPQRLAEIICRTALSKSQNYAVLTSSVNPHHHNNFSSKSNNSTNKKKQPEDNKKSKSKPSDASAAVRSESATSVEEMELARARARRLAEDDRDTSLDVGPNNRPLFTKTPSLSLLTRKDACTYFKFRYHINGYVTGNS
ncbi:hypothetical protein Pint_30717 [Pistacia integerrima]|uniref:Uncharacterized protein n=1 Tax=Pistacia integerrima TaxID=434235 RepID=A0ACC0WX16_9ROSI|nr:hypothetical protein Pint_30717 [Pistacia integerrima]